MRGSLIWSRSFTGTQTWPLHSCSTTAVIGSKWVTCATFPHSCWSWAGSNWAGPESSSTYQSQCMPWENLTSLPTFSFFFGCIDKSPVSSHISRIAVKRLSGSGGSRRPPTVPVNTCFICEFSNCLVKLQELHKCIRRNLLALCLCV